MSFKRITLTLAFLAVLSTTFASTYEALTRDFVYGKAEVKSITVMSFGPEGILFLGDSKAGKLYALDMGDRVKNDSKEAFNLDDLEGKLAALLGADPKGVLIHDMAVNPISQNVYLAVSRADANGQGFWKLPNDLADATLLLRINPAGEITEVDLGSIKHSVAEVPKVVEEGVKNWRDSDNRTEAITDIAYDNGKLYVAGLSNEEFASVLRVLDFPFGRQATYSTIEVWHVAHGKSETEAPIRTLFPYEIDGKKYILAAYTCTPFVSIPVDDLKNGQHVKSKTLGEFGWGNMPIDIIKYRTETGKDGLLMSNSSKAVIRINPEDIPKQEKGLTEPLKDHEYAVGLHHDVLSLVSVTQIDNLNEMNVLMLMRMPNGTLGLRSYPTKYF